jgi:hypothetical protein
MLSATLDEKPLIGLIATEYEVACPGAMLREPGVAPSEKSAS